MNLQDRELELNFREITCKRGVQGDNFAGGVQDFDFSVSGKHAFIPSLSYFVITSKLTVATRAQPIQKNVSAATGLLNKVASPLLPSTPQFRMPYLSDQITYADHFGSTLYNNCFFRAGNSDVSTISQYIPQAAVLKTRLDKSGAWSKYCGRDMSFDDPDFTRRCHKVSLDGTFHEDGLSVQLAQKIRPMLNSAGGAVPFINLSAVPPPTPTTGTNDADYNSATRVLRFTGSNPVNPLASGMAPGDIIDVYISASVTNTYKVINVISTTEVLAEPVSFAAGATVAAAPIIAVFTPCDPRCGFNQVQTVFQPPLGIFSTVNPISGGDFKITLNPNPNFQVAGIQANCSNLTAGTDYKLVIENVLFYACQIRADVSPTGIIPLSLLEMSVLNKSLSGMGAGSTQNIDFTVPPSTLALTVFVQSTKSGTNNIYPPTQFYSANSTVPNLQQNPYNIVNNIQYIQVTYGSVTKTQTLYSSQYKPADAGDKAETIDQYGVNYNIQRWLQSIQYSGKITSDGGAESQPNFLDRGNYWHFDFSRDKNDTSSYVNVQLSFNQPLEIGPTDQLFIVAHYSRQAEIQYENGFITQVVSVNR